MFPIYPSTKNPTKITWPFVKTKRWCSGTHTWIAKSSRQNTLLQDRIGKWSLMDNIILFLFVWHLSHAAFLELSHEKRAPGRLGYIGDDKLPSYREYNKPWIKDPAINQPGFNGIRKGPRVGKWGEPRIESGVWNGDIPAIAMWSWNPEGKGRTTKKPCLGVYWLIDPMHLLRPFWFVEWCVYKIVSMLALKRCCQSNPINIHRQCIFYYVGLLAFNMYIFRGILSKSYFFFESAEFICQYR